MVCQLFLKTTVITYRAKTISYKTVTRTDVFFNLRRVLPLNLNCQNPRNRHKRMNERMPASHLGMVRGSSIKGTETETVNQNISKAQRAAYSLMPVGLHGVNGLDPETSLHLIRIYAFAWSLHYTA